MKSVISGWFWQYLQQTVELYWMWHDECGKSERADTLRDKMDATWVKLTEQERDAVRMVAVAISAAGDWETMRSFCETFCRTIEPTRHSDRPAEIILAPGWRDRTPEIEFKGYRTYGYPGAVLVPHNLQEEE
jgi:hypothetical protein